MKVVDHTFDFDFTFYEELDMTNRGATFGNQSSADFYAEAGNSFLLPLLSRSGAQGFETALNSDEELFLKHDSKFDEQDSQMALSSCGQFLLEHRSKLHVQGTSRSEIPDFEQAAQPPELPFGGFVGPTVVLEKARAADVMQSMYAHLQDQPGVAVTKLRLQKCSMTILACVQEGDLLLQCCVKARLFKPGARDGHDNLKKIVVEFQRRDGDTVAFARIFNRIVSDLRALFILQAKENEDASSSTATVATSSLANTAAERTANVLQPYIDALEKTTSPAEQADVLAATAVLAQKAPKVATAFAAALAHPQGVLQPLQSSLADVVAYPALMLASRLHENAHPLAIH